MQRSPPLLTLAAALAMTATSCIRACENNIRY